VSFADPMQVTEVAEGCLCTATFIAMNTWEELLILLHIYQFSSLF